jgi:transposase
MVAKRYVVKLEAAEREELLALVKRGKVLAQRRVHAQVLLKADEGGGGPAWIDRQIAEALDIHPNTVANIRERFVEQGLEAALSRKKQPPRLRKLDGAQEARLIAIACGQPPEGRARWSLRLLAHRVVELDIVDEISHETVRQTLKKTRSSPTATSTG